tara:strand:+ start:2024 stop:2713 length:690 start_codon:yes stop_codon:yes gene_type:complete
MQLRQSLTLKTRVGGGFAITDVSGLQLWLQYNTGQGAITDGIQWNDQSGNNRHASQTIDAQEGSGFSGGAFVTDAGSQDNLDFASTFSDAGDYHVFMVLDLSEESNETFITSVDNASFMRFGQGGVAADFRMKNGGTTLNITLSSGFGTDKAIAEVSRNGSNLVNVLKNATSLGTGTGAGTFSFEQIGSSSNSLTSASIFEVVVFNKLLTGSDLTNVRNDIADRNGITI